MNSRELFLSKPKVEKLTAIIMHEGRPTGSGVKPTLFKKGGNSEINKKTNKTPKISIKETENLFISV